MYKPLSKEELSVLEIKEKQLSFDIQGLECWTPPVGWIYDYIEDKWKYTGVHRRSASAKDCFWEKDGRWRKYEAWRKEELKQQAVAPEYKHPELSEFIKDCWVKRLSGMWFYIRDVPTYITGQHWLYLSCYNFDGEKVKYRKVDFELYYAWQYCWEDPDCYGLINVTKRRNGKSACGGLIAIDYATRIPYFHAGIQSKTEKDARNVVYKKAVVSPYRKFPYFFQPVSNLPKGGGIPASGLQFSSGKMGLEEDELESLIDFGSSIEGFYDGTKLGLWIDDEPGKTLECDVYRRWNVVKYCLMDDEGNIIGKSYHATTVEEMDSGGEEFFNMWKDSDQKEKQDGRTVSGLYKIFTPAYRTRKVNEYGECDEEAVKQEILRERERLRSKPRELASAIRKEPFDEREAFQMDAQTCLYDFNKINDRVADLRWLPSPYQIGNLQWVNGERFTEVEFVPNPNGRLMVREHPVPGTENRVMYRSGKWIPNNTENYCGGGDPYDQDFVEEGSEKKMSFGSFAVIKKPNPITETDMDNGIVCLYLHRPDNTDILYEDALKIFWYYGCLGLVERNKSLCIDYFTKNNCEGFIPYIGQERHRGIYATKESNNKLSELNEWYIQNYINKVWFIQLLTDWLKFSPSDTTKYDAAMATGYALMMLRMPSGSVRRPEVKKEASQYFSYMQRRSVQKKAH